jgi:hypothetical protein
MIYREQEQGRLVLRGQSEASMLLGAERRERGSVLRAER